MVDMPGGAYDDRFHLAESYRKCLTIEKTNRREMQMTGCSRKCDNRVSP